MPGIKLDNTKVLERIHSLRLIYDEIENVRFGKDKTYLNLDLLRNCVESYFYDLERAKHFHEIKLADQHKIASFTMLWIAKIRPIQIIPNEEITLPQILANEIFAFYSGINFLHFESDQISEKYLKNMLYTLRYRNLDGLTLASQMYILERCMNKEAA